MIAETEGSFVVLLLDPACRAWARAAMEARYFSDPFLGDAFSVACEWDRDHEEALTLPGWAKAVAQKREMDWHEAGVKIAEMTDYCAAAPGNLSAYAAIIRSDWERRELEKLGADVLRSAKDKTVETEALAIRAMRAGEIIRQRNPESVSGTDAIMQESDRNSSGLIPLGFRKLDALLDGGIRPGELVTVAGRTGMGKSAFAIDVARNCCLNAIPVGYVTLEMTPNALAKRLAAGNPEALRLVRFMYPRSRPTVTAIEAVAQNWTADGLGLLVVDHLQLVAPESGNRSRYEIVTEIVHDLKRMARSLEVPVMLLSQLHRPNAGNPHRQPELSDLRDSGAIEEDSDSVILLHRPAYYDPKADEREAWAGLAKNRNGATGTARLDWYGPNMTFRDPGEGELL